MLNRFYGALNGEVSLDKDYQGNLIPTGIINGGCHSDDFERRFVHTNYTARDMMLQRVIDSQLERLDPRE